MLRKNLWLFLLFALNELFPFRGDFLRDAIFHELVVVSLLHIT